VLLHGRQLDPALFLPPGTNPTHRDGHGPAPRRLPGAFGD
jgi:hypothetical protein